MAKKTKTTRKQAEKKITEITGVEFSRRGQLENFWKKQPFYYDSSKIFWLWDNQEKKWVNSDVIDFLNSIQKSLGIETIDAKARGDLEAGFKQVGRKHKPEEVKNTWVQFKERIYDVKTGEVFEATPKYFVTNPIPWNVGESEETPTIDKYFCEWVGEKEKRSLYEFIAYSISLNKFMQRLFGFVGGGSNGKGTFIKVVYKFLGEDNCVTSEIKSLSEDKFEPAVLYRKLLCVMGEVNYNDIRNTNMLKKLAGEDKISFQFKGKTPFTAENTATCICLTNSLPITPDKSLGFYRKWKLEDFPNKFLEIKEDLIQSIPKKEFENLAKKSLRILKELYEKKKFHHEGSFEFREQRYEERSNPVMKFVIDHCEEIAGQNTALRIFSNACNEYLKSKHLRLLTAKQVGRVLRDEGFSVGSRDGKVVIINLIIKEKTLKPLKTSKSILAPYVETNVKHNGYASYNDFEGKNKELSDIKPEKPGSGVDKK